MLFDSHCHLTDARFADDVDAVLERARACGVTRIVTVASDVEDATRAIRIAESNADVWATAGIHPHVADGADDAALARVHELAAHDRVVAIGETGLDFYYDNSDRGAQRASFARHLHLAEQLRLPIIVHSRNADEETAAFLKDADGVTGVLHCFAGGAELLEAGLGAGWYISFAGLITFKNFAAADLLRAVPDDRLLIETDSPYLAPVPHRGGRNEPAFVAEVARGAAAIRGEAFEDLVQRTWENASRLYGLPPS